MSRKKHEKHEKPEKTEELKKPEEQEKPEKDEKHEEHEERKESEKESKKKTEKKPIAWVYVGDKNRLEVDLGKDKGSIILWRNTVYRKLPECKAIEELKEKGLLKPIYG